MGLTSGPLKEVVANLFRLYVTMRRRFEPAWEIAASPRDAASLSMDIDYPAYTVPATQMTAAVRDSLLNDLNTDVTSQ
jgi:hypothetical protein